MPTNSVTPISYGPPPGFEYMKQKHVILTLPSMPENSPELLPLPKEENIKVIYFVLFNY